MILWREYCFRSLITGLCRKRAACHRGQNSGDAYSRWCKRTQLSIDRRLDVRGHFERARSLADLRDEGVLILASGNIVHNLRDAIARMRSGSIETPEWATRFDEPARDIPTRRDTDALLSLWSDSDHGRQAHPTPDHWLPLIYAYGATDGRDRANFPNEGFDLGSISMRNVILQ